MNNKSTVAVIKCSSYNKSDIFPAIDRGFELLGGASSFVKNGERIVLKPNVLSGTKPSLCVTTHPSVFEGVINGLKGLEIDLLYGDSPGLLSPKAALKLSKLYEVAEHYNVKLADFKNYKKISSDKTLLKKTIPIARGVLDADGLISICKLKTHALTRMTGAVKNQYGCIPGLIKAKYHATYPLIFDLSSLIVDVNILVHPRFYIMDAIEAMEGNGPQSGTPKKIGCLLLSKDPVALDAVACKIIDLNPDFVPTCRIGQKVGLGTLNYEKIEIVGDPIKQFINKKFDVVRKPIIVVTGEGIISRIKRSLVPKPFIDPSACIVCGKCVEICPFEPKAIYWKNNRKSDIPPIYSYNLCKRCFCCQEVCLSKAIYIKTPKLSFLLSFLTLLRLGFSAIRSLLKRLLKTLQLFFNKGRD